MKKIFLGVFAILLILSLTLVGCSQPSSAPAPAASSPKSAPAAAPALKTKLRWAGMPLATAGPEIAIVDFLNRNTNLDISLEATAGPTAVPQVMQQGAQLGGATVFRSIIHSYFGYERFKGNAMSFMRLMIVLNTQYMGWLTGPNTGVKTVYDVKGKRLTYDAGGTNIYIDLFLPLIGFSKSDVKLVEIANPAAGRAAVMAGIADVAAGTMIGGVGMLEMKDKLGKVVVVPLPKEKLMEARQKYPAEFSSEPPGLLPPGAVAGLDNTEPIECAKTANVLMARSDTSDEIVYTIVKTMLTNAQAISGASIDLKGWKPEQAAGMIPIPFHNGSIKAFKEFGLWNNDLEAEQQKLLKQGGN